MRYKKNIVIFNLKKTLQPTNQQTKQFFEYKPQESFNVKYTDIIYNFICIFN